MEQNYLEFESIVFKGEKVSLTWSEEANAEKPDKLTKESHVMPHAALRNKVNAIRDIVPYILGLRANEDQALADNCTSAEKEMFINLRDFRERMDELFAERVMITSIVCKENKEGRYCVIKGSVYVPEVGQSKFETDKIFYDVHSDFVSSFLFESLDDIWLECYKYVYGSEGEEKKETIERKMKIA